MTQPTAPRVTAADVARVAGVSRATVSYVLNDTPNQKIPPQTRERVLEAARTLGYIPSSAARALAKGRSDGVLLVLPDWPMGSTMTSIIERLTDEFDANGLSLLTRRRRPDQPLTALWADLLPRAVIALEDIDPREEEVMHAAGIHVASALFAPGRDGNAHAIPQSLIGDLQVQHLAATGHRHLAYAAPRDPRVRVFLEPRLDGVRRACLDLGLDQPVTTEIDLDARDAAAAVQQWRAADPRITAVCAYNDDLAFAVLAGMRTLGLSAPGDLAVIGVDNVPLSPFAAPPLTTVDPNQAVTAAHLARVVINGLAGKRPPPAPRSDAFTLVVRESA